MDTYGGTHQGYLDGLRGKDPDIQFVTLDDYETGWLHGVEDRANGVEDRFGTELPTSLCRGALVKIPKGTRIKTTYHGERLAGRSYQVKLHDVYRVCPAYVGPGGDFHRPEPARVVWPGTGGYWSEASAVDVVVVG